MRLAAEPLSDSSLERVLKNPIVPVFDTRK